jgi:hypothetical protein
MFSIQKLILFQSNLFQFQMIKNMKVHPLFVAIVIMVALISPSCKKCEQPIPVVPIKNYLIGTWAGKETYKAYVNDSLTTTNVRDISMVMNEDFSGSFTSFSLTSPMAWSNSTGKVSIVMRLTSTISTSSLGYLFDVKDSTATTQKWYTENYFSDQSGKKQKYSYEWQLTKK